MLSPVVGHCLPATFVFPPGRQDHGAHADIKGLVIVALDQERLHIIVNNSFGQGIRESPFQAITHLNARAPVLYKQEQDRTIVLSLLAGLPGRGGANRIILQYRSGR